MRLSDVAMLRPLSATARARCTHTNASRKRSDFKASWPSTVELLDREARALMVRARWELFTVMTDVDENRVRKDGDIIANARRDGPAAAVHLTAKSGPLLFVCDTFDRWEDNVRAIALGLEALRKVERYGMGTGTEQYVGFGELGSGIPMPSRKMTAEEAADLLAAYSLPEKLISQAMLDPQWIGYAYRQAARREHPDAGGDADKFKRLTEARDLLLALATD